MTAATPFEVLFADFNEAHVSILREALSVPGAVQVRLHVARTGREALDRLFRVAPFEAAARPDLLLMDLDLPVVPGLDVVKLVKGDPRLRTMPVVVPTRSATLENIAEAYRRGANCVVARPVALDEFTALLRAVLDYWGRTATLVPGSSHG